MQLVCSIFIKVKLIYAWHCISPRHREERTASSAAQAFYETKAT